MALGCGVMQRNGVMNLTKMKARRETKQRWGVSGLRIFTDGITYSMHNLRFTIRRFDLALGRYMDLSS